MLGLRGACLQLVLCSVVLANAAPARAVDTERIQSLVRVEPGATCLTAARLAAEVEPLLDDVQVPNDFRFVVQGSATDSRVAKLRILRGDQVVAERAFDPGPELCSRFHTAVGLTIALAINAARVEQREPPRQWAVAGAGLLAYGVVPQLSPGLELQLRHGLGEHAWVRAGLLGAFAFGVSLDDGEGAFDATLVAARIDGCARTELGSGLRGAGCFGLLGGALHAAGDQLMQSSSATVPWLALSGSANVDLALSESWSLELGLSANVLLHRVEVGLENTEGIQTRSLQLQQVSFALGFGPVYNF